MLFIVRGEKEKRLHIVDSFKDVAVVCLNWYFVEDVYSDSLCKNSLAHKYKTLEIIYN